MREKGAWSEATYRTRAAVVETKGAGKATFEAEERVRQGKGLDALVDPSKGGVIRYANNLLVPAGDIFDLPYGIAMPVKTEIDTTGSMGGNVDIAFAVQPKVQNLLIQGAGAVLKRYHAQLATGVVQDTSDQFPYQTSQFEPDNEVERQMGLLVPERAGDDAPEEYQLGLFSTAFLTRSTITKYGLRGYHFIVGDVIGRDALEKRLIERVFGPTALDLAFGGSVPTNLPSTIEVGQELLKRWHGFFLQVGQSTRISKWWSEVLGAERVIVLPRTEDIAEVQAVVIGLTEGVLDLQSAFEYLEASEVSKARAAKIIEACSEIPLGLQASLPNFDTIPLSGAKFASRDDAWPIGADAPEAIEAKSDAADKPAKGKKKWKI
ncbi:MAG TPA: hypothetical protein VJB97_04190 [Candidatus Paceibacterota bacterium]